MTAGAIPPILCRWANKKAAAVFIAQGLVGRS